MKDINEVNPGLLGVTEQGVQLFGHVVRYLVRVKGVEKVEEEACLHLSRRTGPLHPREQWSDYRVLAPLNG